MNIVRAKKIKLIAAVIFLAATMAVPMTLVQARPQYMKIFNADPFTKDEFRDQCTVCHISRAGGENTYFGEDFGVADHKLTKDLREKYPDFFTKEPRQKDQ